MHTIQRPNLELKSGNDFLTLQGSNKMYERKICTLIPPARFSAP